MKESDYQIRCLLMNALLRRGTAYRKVAVVERDEDGTKHSFDIETRFRDLYGEIDFMPIGFKKYVEGMN
jgi:ATP-dependent 26S proteasome regulatory subunit